MIALAWLIPAALALGLLGLVAFIWSLRSGQYEDLEGASWRALDDGDGKPLSAGQTRKPEHTRHQNGN